MTPGVDIESRPAIKDWDATIRLYWALQENFSLWRFKSKLDGSPPCWEHFVRWLFHLIDAGIEVRASSENDWNLIARGRDLDSTNVREIPDAMPKASKSWNEFEFSWHTATFFVSVPEDVAFKVLVLGFLP